MRYSERKDMSYTALYRKFRPATFDDVKGQDETVTILKNQIMGERIGHAYIFTGTRGTGKTSSAKIFARAVNCEHPVNGSPCGECASCKALVASNSMNVIEIDAASNNSVDNIRSIIEDVQYPPASGKYKVYIIDEVHMLSGSAFNALLKTLEEPPEYVIFILATTEIQKVPLTILSRCQRYDFHRISLETITARLASLMEKEGIQYEEKALNFIARKGDGSMRDSLSLLDECISFYFGEPLTYEHTLEVLGAVDTDTFTSLFKGIAAHDVPACLDVSEKISVQGMDLTQFVADFIWFLRNLLLIKASPDATDRVEVSESDLEVMKNTANETSEEILFRLINIFAKLSADLKYSTSKRVLFETALIKICHPESEKTYEALVDRVSALEKKIEEGNFNLNVSPARKAKAEAVPKKKEDVVRVPISVDEKTMDAAIMTVFKETMPDGLQRAMIDSAKLHYDKETGMVVVGVKDKLDKELFDKNDKINDEIKEKIASMIGNDKVRINYTVDKILAGDDDEFIRGTNFIEPSLIRNIDE